jgi:hypothetical protein
MIARRRDAETQRRRERRDLNIKEGLINYDYLTQRREGAKNNKKKDLKG